MQRDVALVLCDWAESINGKLYVMGGGWSVTSANSSLSAGVGIVWRMSWDEADREHDLTIRLYDEDGRAVCTASGEEISATAHLGGCTRDDVAGVPSSTALALNFTGLCLGPGRYRFEVEIDGDLEAAAPFAAKVRSEL